LSSSNEFAKLEKEVQNDIIKVEALYKKNKDKVVEFLLEHVKFVDITVPEVVKGNFDEKFGKANE
jgi:hypothetical protein